MGLGGVRPASLGASIEVVEYADRRLEQEHRQPEPDGRPRVPCRDEGHDPSHDPIEERRERVGQPEVGTDPTPRVGRPGPGSPGASDVDDLPEVGHEIGDEPVATVRDLGVDAGNEGVQGDRGDHQVASAVATDDRRRPAT